MKNNRLFALSTNISTRCIEFQQTNFISIHLMFSNSQLK